MGGLVLRPHACKRNEIAYILRYNCYMYRANYFHGSLKGASETANYLLSGPFCFVQTSDGKIVSVHYGPDEKPAIVNLKKAVAAAFQANFKYTEQEVEEDTLTTHVSQYR